MLTAQKAQNILQRGHVLRIAGGATDLNGAAYNLNSFGASDARAAVQLEMAIETGTLPDDARQAWERQLDATLGFVLAGGRAGSFLLVATCGHSVETSAGADRYLNAMTFPKVNSVAVGFQVTASHLITGEDSVATLRTFVIENLR